MKIRVTEVRVYDVPGTVEPEIRAAIRRSAVEELGDFLCDLSDWPAESVDVVAVEEVRRRAPRSERFIQPVDGIKVIPRSGARKRGGDVMRGCLQKAKISPETMRLLKKGERGGA